ncbi:TM2 domain-containing protein [Nocardioides cavernaquae]|uniref:TM2 domain-containing protein n=1 Tax=Nocardioides cavernaquae TaxID=2321396 RepID=A0A3A5HHU8_9ACTN|nr:TM2 domain-containing protein [Nocardioides cavernaquae]RJS47634.1 TM2 domain-containing protein [Nocardioides cavernaquae]
MTETPQTPEGHEPTQPLPPLPPPPAYGQPPVPPQGPYGYQAPAYGAPGFNPAAPYGVHPLTGVPYSDKSKLVAGLLQILIPLGIGRMYMGQTGLGVAQLLVTIFTCGIGGLWPFIDGIVILAGDSKDQFGRPLRS